MRWSQPIEAAAREARQWRAARSSAAFPGAGAAAGLLLLTYLMLAVVMPAGGLFSSDQGVKYAQVEALGRSGTLKIDSVAAPASVFRQEFTGPFYREIEAQYQAKFSAAFAILVLPAFLVLGDWGLILPAILSGAAAAYASGRISALLGARYPGAVTLVVGLASPLAFYSLTFWEHAPSVALLSLATLAALQGNAVVSGLLSALAAWFRPEAYLFGPWLAAAALLTIQRAEGRGFFMRFGSGYLLGLLPWWLYNLLSAGSAFGPHVEADGTIVAARFQILAQHLVPLSQKKWLVVLGVSLLVCLFLWRRGHSARAVLALVSAGAAWICLAQLFQGLIPHSVTDAFPFAFAAMMTLVVRWQDPRIRFISVLTAGYLLGVVSLIPADPGAQWGPRMLLGMYPLLGVLAWLGWEVARGLWVRLALASLLAVSLGLQLAGLRYLYTVERQWDQLTTELSALTPGVIVTAIWWLPQVGAPTFRSTRWYGVIDERELGDVAAREESFWWIWSSEKPQFFAHRLAQTTDALSGEQFVEIERRRLSARQLEAVHYRVLPDRGDDAEGGSPRIRPAENAHTSVR